MPAKRPHVLAARRSGFTLVEIMVVLIIIGILAALLVPAVNYAVNRGRNVAIRMEVNSLDMAVKQYQLKYGDFPPDGSSWPLLQRHMRKAFPRMAEPDNSLLAALTHTMPDGSFSPVAMDRAEALVFFLGGFSSDPAHPLTGTNGPLEYLGSGSPTALTSYGYNATRDNASFEFDSTRMPLKRTGTRYTSADEERFSVADPAHGTAGDLLPVYLLDGGETPIVYFDSRTYGDVGGGIYNGYSLADAGYGGVRPYKTANNADPPKGSSYGTVPAAFAAIKFVNDDSFQIIAPGRDNHYGSIVDHPAQSGLPVHFTVATGRAFWPNKDASSLNELLLGNIEGFQEMTVQGVKANYQLDNITNFSGTTLEGDLAE